MKKIIFLMFFLTSMNVFSGAYANIPLPKQTDMFEGVMQQWLQQKALNLRKRQIDIEERRAQAEVHLQEQEAEINQLKIAMVKEKVNQLKKNKKVN